MNKEEQQALRRKHVKIVAPGTYNLYICNVCRESVQHDLMWQAVAYPCSVIELLNALEIAECNHTRFYICRCDKPDCGKRNVPGHDKKYAFCPKCGLKL